VGQAVGQALEEGNGLMKSAPPRVIEVLLGFLIPPACREEVLGDLYERYAGSPQYILDALRAVPLVIVSRVRRTTDPAVLLMEALSLCLSFLVGAWYVDRAFLVDRWGLWRLAIPVAAVLLAMVLRDAYAAPGSRPRWEAALRPVLGAGCAFLIDLSWRTVPLWIVLWGGGLSIVLVSTLRMAFPPVASLPRGAGGPPFWQHYVTDPWGLSPGAAAIVVAVVLILLIPYPSRFKGKLLGVVLVWAVLFVYGHSKRN
jgi:hypothetical protein